MVAAVHRRLKKKHPDLLTIIVPRHPDRGGEIAAELNAQGLAVSKRSSGDALGAGTDIYLADTLGELGLFFRLAGIAFMGKSLVPMGGQNPLEAAKLGCAIVHGPHMMNFEDITERLKGADAALEVADEAALEAAIGRLLDDAAECERLATAACDIAAAEAGVLDAVVGELQPYLDNLAEGESSHACA